VLCHVNRIKSMAKESVFCVCLLKPEGFWIGSMCYFGVSSIYLSQRTTPCDKRAHPVPFWGYKYFRTA
jgi:hypothetical protein